MYLMRNKPFSSATNEKHPTHETVLLQCTENKDPKKNFLLSSIEKVP
jgi:hypothetical protein